MSERSLEEKSMPAIWRVPDEQWEKIEPILVEHDPPNRTGRPRTDRRAVLDAVIVRLRTGCQWNRIPKEFPDDSTVHRTFQQWVEFGVLDRPGHHSVVVVAKDGSQKPAHRARWLA